MSRTTGTRNPNSARLVRRVGGGIAIGAFLVIAGGLATVAVIQSGAPAVSTATPLVTATATPTSVPDTTGDTTPIAPATRLISAFDATTAWRSTIGSCPDSEVVIERSTDGGSVWNGFNLGSGGGVSGILALQAYDDADSAYLIGLDAAACAPAWVGTSTGGASWAAYSDRSAATWYPEPGDPTHVHTEVGSSSATPCEVAGLASFSTTSAALLCTDRSIHRTADAGVTWSETVGVSGALAIGQTSNGYLVAADSSDVTCSGVAVTFVPESLAGDPTPVSSCVTTGSTGAEVAVSGTSDALWLWTGTVVLRSLDGGKTWQ